MSVVVFCGCSASRPGPRLEPVRGATESGIASWYGPGFHGNPTSSGEVYDQNDLTAAHRTLPLGTRVAVTHLETRRAVEVRVNDRGPFVDGRIIDLSRAAAEQLDIIGPGTGPVLIEVLGNGSRPMPAARYAVQVGSFTDRANADRLRARLDDRFGAAYVSTLDADSGRYFRVRLGTFAERSEAVDRAREVARLGLPAVIVEDGSGH